MKNTLVYNLFFSKNYRHHFHVIKTFRPSYTERFHINGYEGFFMWHYYKSYEKEIYLLTLKKDNRVLTEFIDHNISNISINNTLNITNFNENDNKTVNKSDISQKLIKTIEEKNDSHIISCGCCKR
jgi:hypothetical protein